MQLSQELKQLIETLQLEPHPEGGFYRETLRSPKHLGEGSHQRSLGTAIYFLVPGGMVTGWHAVASPELWHFYTGAPLVLEHVNQEGHFFRHLLGADLEFGHRPQQLIPEHEWQRAYSTGAYTLCGCTVSPGFDFRDFELISDEKLGSRLPALHAYITRKPFENPAS